MKHYGKSARKARQKAANSCHNVSECNNFKKLAFEEDETECSTIDGEMINRSMGTDAVKKGNGLFIGDYFVGILDSLSGFGNIPSLRY